MEIASSQNERSLSAALVLAEHLLASQADDQGEMVVMSVGLGGGCAGGVEPAQGDHSRLKKTFIHQSPVLPRSSSGSASIAAKITSSRP